MFSFTRNSASQQRPPAPSTPSPTQQPQQAPGSNQARSSAGQPGPRISINNSNNNSPLPRTLQESVNQGNLSIRSASSPRQQPRSNVAANPACIQQLEFMGFHTQLSIAALQACNNNIESAIDFCLENQNSFVVGPPPSSSSPSTSSRGGPTNSNLSPVPSPLVNATVLSTSVQGGRTNSANSNITNYSDAESDSDTDSVIFFMDAVDRQLQSVVSQNAIRNLEGEDLVARIASQRRKSQREEIARVESQRFVNQDPTLQVLQDQQINAKVVLQPTPQRLFSEIGSSSKRSLMSIGTNTAGDELGLIPADSIDGEDLTYSRRNSDLYTTGVGTVFTGGDDNATEEWTSERGDSTDVVENTGPIIRKASPVKMGLRSRESERWMAADLEDDETEELFPSTVSAPSKLTRPASAAPKTSTTAANVHPKNTSTSTTIVPPSSSLDNSAGSRSNSNDRSNSTDRPSLLGLPPARLPDTRLSQQGRPIIPAPRAFLRPVSSSIPMSPSTGGINNSSSSDASANSSNAVAAALSMQSRSPPAIVRHTNDSPSQQHQSGSYSVVPLQIPADQVIVPTSVVSPFSTAATPSGALSESGTSRNTLLGTFRRFIGDNSMADSPTNSRTRELGQASDLSRFPPIKRRQHLPYEVFEVPSEENPARIEHRVFLTMKQPYKKNKSPQGGRTDRVYLGALSSASRAKRMGDAMAPPVWVSKESSTNCVICDCSLAGGYLGQLGNHCRNCGHRVCTKCSTKWPSSMIPATYHNNEKHIRVCDSCDILVERFADALRLGKLEESQAIFSTGNINPHCQLSIYENQDYPIHLAAQSGNLEIVKWLLDDRIVPLVDVNRKSLKTVEGYTILGLAAKYGHTDIIKYLVTFHRCKVVEITNLLHLQRVLHVILEV